jgi:hypothetical protein
MDAFYNIKTKLNVPFAMEIIISANKIWIIRNNKIFLLHCNKFGHLDNKKQQNFQEPSSKLPELEGNLQK